MVEEEERVVDEEERVADEEERAADEAQKAAELEPGSWEEQIWALQLEPVVEEEMTAEAAKSGSPNPRACYHCRNQKQECVWLR